MPTRAPVHRPRHYKTRSERLAEHSKETASVYNWQWRKLRGAFLQHHPLCQRCASKGIVQAAEHVHHVVPVKEAPERLLDWSNLMAVCRACHDEIEPRGFIKHERKR